MLSHPGRVLSMCDNIDPAIESKYTDPLGRAEDILERIKYAEKMINDIIDPSYLSYFKIALEESKTRVVKIIDFYSPYLKDGMESSHSFRINKHAPEEFWIFRGYDNK